MTLPNTEQDFIDKILECNAAYRLGKPIISDDEFDALLVAYSKSYPKNYESLRKTLFAASGDVVHNYIMNSLEKLTYQRGDSALLEWLTAITDNENKQFCISEKLDGMSMQLIYKNGILVSAETRGDGKTGVQQINKLMHIVPTKISYTKDITIRGELTLTFDSFDTAKTISKENYKNLRNATVGIINSDAPSKELLHCLTFIAYRIVNTFDDEAFKTFNQQQELEFLSKQGFKIPQYKILAKEELTCNALKALDTSFEANKICQTDGLVIQLNSSTNGRYENKLLPDNARAFKFNELIAVTKVKEIQWSLSKARVMCPVAILEPVNLGGASVSRCTLHNAEAVLSNKIIAGVEIKISKSGDIIPFFIERITQLPESTVVNLPKICPICGATLVKNSVDLVCPNTNCKGGAYKSLAFFLKLIGVENVSYKTLAKWELDSISSLLCWEPNQKYKSQCSFYKELETKLFSCAPETLLKCMDWDGISIKTWNKILEVFEIAKLNNLIASNNASQLQVVRGVGALTIEQIIKKWPNIINDLNLILNDKRYSFTAMQVESFKNDKLKGKSFCITGSLSKARKLIENDITNNGGQVINSVTKELSYLITNDTTTNSSKLLKAKQLGIHIITEEELNNML